MASIIKVDDVQDAAGNNIINESGDTITIGAAGDTVDVPGTEVKTNKVSPTSGTGLQLGDSGDTITIPSGATITNSGTATGFSSAIGHSSVYMTADTAISGDGNLTADLSIYNASAAGTGIIDDITSGEIRVDKTGFYLAILQFTGNITTGDDSFNQYIATTDGTTISRRGYGYTHIEESDEDQFTTTIHAIVDVDNVSNVKFLMRFQGANNITLYGTGQSVTSLTLIRLGDT